MLCASIAKAISEVDEKIFKYSFDYIDSIIWLICTIKQNG